MFTYAGKKNVGTSSFILKIDTLKIRIQYCISHCSEKCAKKILKKTKYVP